MARPTPTPPEPSHHKSAAAKGEETHPSWASVRFNKASVSPPGAKLVDSDIHHQHIVTMKVSTMSRHRDLHHTWWHEDRVLLEVEMSEAQFAAAITSFGDGSARPATLVFHAQGDADGPVAQCDDPMPGEIQQSIAEVRSATKKATEQMAAAIANIERLLDEGATKKALKQAVVDARFVAGNMPSNMAFAGESLAKTVEKVVTKATHDIEALVEGRARAIGMELDARPIMQELLAPPTDERKPPVRKKRD